MIEDALFHHERFIETEEDQAHATGGKICDDLCGIPSICASSPGQSDDERGKGARHGENADEIDVENYFFEVVVATEERSRWKVSQGNPKGG